MSNLGDILRQVVSTPSHIPKDWVFLKLIDICNPKQWKTISSTEMTKAGYPVFGANGFVGFYPEYNHEDETIAITCRGNTCGTINRIPPQTYITGNSMALDDIKSSVVLQDYLYYALKYRGVGDSVSGSAQPQITGAGLRPIEFPAPPLSEQQKIAAILSSVDAVIEKTRAQIDKLKDLKTAMMQELLTKGIGHSEFKDSPVGRIPKGWEVKTLDQLAVFVTSGSRGWAQYYSKAGSIFIRIGNLTREHINLRFNDIVYVCPPDSAEGKRTQVQLGDVLISITADLGIIGVINKSIGEAYVNQHISLVRLRDPNQARWIGYFLAFEDTQNQFIGNNDAGAKAGLNLPSIRSTIVAMPKKNERDRIVAALDSLDKSIVVKRTKLTNILSLKKALMQDLLTGKVRVDVSDVASVVS